MNLTWVIVGSLVTALGGVVTLAGVHWDKWHGETLPITKAKSPIIEKINVPIKQQSKEISKEEPAPSIMKAEKIRLELIFLDQLYDRVTNNVHPIFETAHHLRNDWPEEILQTGKEPMKVKIKDLQKRLNEEIKVLAPLLEKNRYLGDYINDIHRDTLRIMVDLIHEGDTLINKADQLGDITRRNIQFLMPDRERFGGKVTEWGDWLDNLKKSIQAKKIELLSK